MSEQPTSRFTPQNQTTHERLSTHTVGLVALSDFRKKRAQVLEQQEREAREAASATRTNVSTPDRALTATPGNGSDTSEAERQKKKRKRTKPLVSFHGDLEDDEEETGPVRLKAAKTKKASRAQETDGGGSENNTGEEGKTVEKKKIVNPSVAFVPKFRTPKTIQREEAEKEALRKEFLELQKTVKATEIAIPFVFYDGTNIPGGTVRVKKGDHIWLFLDKSRKVGAELGVGSDRSATARRDWARVSVDDLMLVRGTIIIPHHCEIYYFIINKTVGPDGKPLFAYSAEATAKDTASGGGAAAPVDALSKGGPDISTLEGASDDPAFTKVVDRRWYQRNKHIFPASMWQEFDPDKDYRKEVPRDPNGNIFFMTK